jgi:hypothetical protein
MTRSQIIGPQVTGSQGTISRSTSSHTTSQSSSGTQSSSGGIEEGEFPPHGATSEKRKPKWLQDTLKEAQGSMGNPRQAVRESKPPERFCRYLAMVSSIRESEPSTFEEVTL